MTLPDPAVTPSPPWQGRPVGRSLSALLREHASARPEAGAIRAPGGAAWSWARLAEEVASMQAGLRLRGIGRADHVAIMADNGLQTATALLAVIGMGAVAVPVNTGLVGPGLAFVLTHSDAKLLIADPTHMQACRAAGATLAESAVSTEAEAWPRRPGNLLAEGHGTDPAMIMYTSGTTGTAKGVLLGHACCMQAAWSAAAIMYEAEPDDVLYTALPLFHCAAQQLGLWTSLISGAELVLAPRFSAGQFWDHLRTYNVTKFHFIGPLLSILWQAPPSPEDGNHKARLGVGGAPRIAWRECEERFRFDAVETYGMTETFGGCVAHRPRRGRLHSAGQALAHVEVGCVDDAFQPLPAGARGHLLIRPTRPDVLFGGYYKRPDLTEAAFRDGWYLTGDRGTIDADGYLFFTERLRDVIRRRGENVSAVEVETTIAALPGVADCGVAGVPSALGEEDILAVVVPEAGNRDPAALLAALQTLLPAFALPRYVAFTDALPKTATARIQRHLLSPFLHEAFDAGPGRKRP